ncbi:hypothetical protein F4804DRAFT_5818 [Jackrogersella minutella]|nr:hypothetical protein F4804DRAFT_5818 [Jackrogersella minutella]
MMSSYTRNLFQIAISIFILTIIYCVSASSAPPSESPSAKAELICHTDNPADCYPKVFSPTEEFQVLHDDQDIPPGLHVQLDVQTGKKQAKLHNPQEDNPALEGLPVDRSVVVVDSQPPQEEESWISPGAPVYEAEGLVKTPAVKSDIFIPSLEIVKKHSAVPHSVSSAELLQALDDLEDLAHDMYYGLQIAEDPEALHALFCLYTSRDVGQAGTRSITDRPSFLAMATLSSATWNNKHALQALERSWDALLEKPCVSASPATTLAPKAAFYSRLEPTSAPGSAGEAAEAYSIGLDLSAIDGLLRSPKIKAEFLDHDGMKNFLRILLREEEVWDKRKERVATVVSDIFLDEDTGATLGIWPTIAKAADASVCAGGGPEALEEGCWDYHLQRISQDPKTEDWSKELLDLLRKRRSEVPTHERDEL